MKVVVAVATVVSLLAVVGGAGAFTTWSQRLGALLTDSGDRVMEVHGLEIPLTVEEIADRADLIVVGMAASDAVRAFRENTAIPQEDRDPRIYALGAYHDMTFQVLEYVKGSGPSQISVRWLASSPELRIASQPAPELEAGKQYVLFLSEGTGVWSGGYIMLGRRGAGDLAGEQATFAEFGTITLDRIRQAARDSR